MEQALSETEKKKSVLPMFLVVFIDMIGIGIVIPLLAPLFVSAGSPFIDAAPTPDARVMLLGLLLASFSLAQFFGAPILGALSDRHGRKPVLLVAMTATMIGYLLFAYGIMAQNLTLLFVGRIVDGFFGGSISVAFSAIADISDTKSKPKNFGLIGMAFGFGFIIGPFLGGKLADPNLVSWFDFSTPFFFAAALSLFNILLMLFNFKETIHKKSTVKISALTGFRNIRKAFSLPSLRVLFTVIFLLSFGFSFFTQFSQVFLIEGFNFTQSEIGDFFAFVGICIALVQGVVTRPVSARWRPAQILKFAPLLLVVALAAQLFVHESIYLYMIIPFIALAQGLIYPNYTALISDNADRESQGEIFGINQSIQSVALFIPPIISGFIAAVHFSLPIVAAAFFVFVGWVVFLLFYKEKKSEVFHEV